MSGLTGKQFLNMYLKMAKNHQIYIDYDVDLRE
jgi:hypothetical protein